MTSLNLLMVEAMHQTEIARKCREETQRLLQEAQILAEDFRSSQSPSGDTFLQTAGKLDDNKNRLDLAISKTSEDESEADQEETREKPRSKRLASSVSQKLSSIVELTRIEEEEIVKMMEDVSKICDKASACHVLDPQDVRRDIYKVFKEKSLVLLDLKMEINKFKLEDVK